MENLPIDAMGPRGRGVWELAQVSARALAAARGVGPVSKLHTAFVHGFEVALALQQMDPEWARAALDQMLDWEERKWGDAAVTERQRLLKDANVARDLARQHGDA